MPNEEKLKNIIVHIGLHKTGTTSVQSFFSGNRRAFSQAGLHYPESGCVPSEGAHHNIYRYYSENADEQARYDAALGGMSELMAEIGAVDSDVLLSSEGLWVLARDEPGQFRKFLSEVAVGRRPVIVITWRNAAEYCESLYFQNAKSHQMPSIQHATRWFFSIPAEFDRVANLITDLDIELIILQYGSDMVERFCNLLLSRFDVRIEGQRERKPDVNPSMSSVQKLIAAHLSTSSVRLEPSVYARVLEALGDGIAMPSSKQRESIIPERIQRSLIERSVEGLKSILNSDKGISIFPETLPDHYPTRPYLLNGRTSLMFAKLRSKLEGTDSPSAGG